jgi:hypothetical protein
MSLSLMFCMLLLLILRNIFSSRRLDVAKMAGLVERLYLMAAKRALLRSFFDGSCIRNTL